MGDNSAYQLVIEAAEKYLNDNGKISPSTAARSKEVVEFLTYQIESGMLDVDLSPGTLLSYISKAANYDTQSAIVSGGSWGGYWLDVPAHEIKNKKPVEHKKIKIKNKTEDISEKQLYPLVELWLTSKGYVSKDVSNLKSGGKWGNPDIIGINRVELFGSAEIEIASCEVKLTEQNWEQFIFEAISHKRASNRSWFCYRITAENTPMPKGMEYYAEKYKVGIVQLILTDEEIIKLKDGGAESLGLLENVRERVPAVYEFVPLQEKRDLIDRANIKITVAF